MATHPTECCKGVPEAAISHIAVRVLEIRMVEQIEEIRLERKLGSFCDLESFVYTEVDIGIVRSVERAASQRAVAP